jgi:predicted RNA polymerase sigma factor
LCLIFFGRNRYIDRANQKVAKNKIHRRKTEKKRESQKQKANTKKKEKIKANIYITKKDHQD